MPEPNNSRKTERHVAYALGVAVIILAVLVVFVALQYDSLRDQNILSARSFWHARFLSRHAPLPLNDASMVRPWMTFDYINHLFALPPTYLEAQLKIADPQYPRLTVSSYASAASLSETALLNDIETAIRAYSPASASSTTAIPAAPTTTASGTNSI